MYKRQVLALALVGIAHADIDRFLFAVQLNIGRIRGILLLLGADHGQVRAGFDMPVEHVVQRDVGDNIAVRDHNVIRLVFLQEIDRAGQRVDLAAVLAGDERRGLARIRICLLYTSRCV